MIALARRKLTWRTAVESMVGAAVTTAMIFTIIIFAYMFGYFLVLSRVTSKLVTWVGGLSLPVLLVLAVICLVYMLLGTFMDEAALMFLAVPVLVPVVVGLGADPIWFGVMIVLMQQIGLLSPPLGLTVFVVARSTNRPVDEVFAGALPFVVAMVVLVIAFLLFPDILTWLPNRMAP